MKLRIYAAMLTAAFAAWALGACAQPSATPPATVTPQQGNDGVTTIINVVLPDGRTVQCVTWKYFNAGGMSCDWANARAS